MENIIYQLTKENRDQREGMQQLKIQSENLSEELLQLKTKINHHEEDIRQLMDKNKNREEETQTKNGIGTRKKRQIADGVTSSGSWTMLEISDRVIGNMDYDNYGIKIYDHVSNKDANKKNIEKKYFFEPIGQLDHHSAKSAFNNFSKKLK